MKANIKGILKRGLAILLASSTLVACNNDDFFLLEDRNGMESEAVWASEGSINFHLNKTYELIIPKWPHQVIPNRWDIHLASDENYFASEPSHAARALGIHGEPLHNHDVFYVGNIYTLNYGSNRYLDIARCNNAIKFIPESPLSDEAKRRFLGQYHTMRAMVYLELVKVYGGTTLVLEPQDPQDLQVKGRASARECFDVIIDDLTKAVNYLDGVIYSGDDWGRITQEAAASLKAKALLYWASPQFNPLTDPKHPYDASRWTTALEANKAAYDLCMAKGHSLVEDYEQIWQIQGPTNKETIISRPYSSSRQNRGHDEERKNRPQSEGGSPNRAYRATLKLLQAYPMKDGNDISQTGNYTYDPVMFWQNRDPRFTATFAYNGSVYPLSGNTNRVQWTYVGAVNNGINEGANWGVYTKKFTTPSLPAGQVELRNSVGGSGMDWIEMRLAEVMLNYADCANETGDMGTAKNMVRTIRQRAGIEAGSNDYGLGSVASIAEMRDLILNERMIEFSFENKRNSDLRRTRRWHLLSGESLETIRIELQDGVKADDLNGGDRNQIDVEDKEDYEKYFRMSIQQQNNGFGAMNIPEYHNFYTFHNDYVYRGVDIYPTIGWAGGTFDPLDN